MRVVESFVLAKTGQAEQCEDALFANQHFAAVVDGATDKSGLLFAGRTPGQAAADAVLRALSALAARATAPQAAAALTESVAEVYRQESHLERAEVVPAERATASVVIYSAHRREVWMVGDCQAWVDGTPIRNAKVIDRIVAEARALFLECELAAGRSVEKLRRDDPGRDFILPLLKRQSLFQNARSDSPYAYGVVDGFPIAPQHIKVVPVDPGARTLILASDGYPVVHPTLVETEAALAVVLRDDPLCIRGNPSTKGVEVGQLSFDDRAYLRVDL